MRFEVLVNKNGHQRSFPCRTIRAVNNLVTDMLNKDQEVVIRPFVSRLPVVTEVKRVA